MPNGFETQLTGPAVAALRRALGLPDEQAGGGAILPSAPVSPVTPPFVPDAGQIPGGQLPSSMPGGDLSLSRPSLEQVLPLLIAGTKGQAARTAPIAPPTSQPQPTSQKLSALQNILARIGQGIQVGISDDPGAALGQMVMQRRNEQLQREQQARQEQLNREREQRDFERQLTTIAIQEDVASRREDRVDQRQAERDKAEFMRRQQELLGERTFRAQEAELNRMFELKRQQEAERIADEKQQNLFKQQQAQKARDFAKEYRLQGAGQYAKELGEYDAGLRDTLTPGAEKSLAAVNARVQRLQGLAARQGTGGAAGESNQLVELTNGQVVPMKALKYSSDGSVAGFPPGTYIKQIITRQTGPASTMTIEQKIEAARARGATNAQILQAIQADAPGRLAELTQKYGLGGAPMAAPEKPTPILPGGQAQNQSLQEIKSIPAAVGRMLRPNEDFIRQQGNAQY
ncbi:MAG TPA: hypothetical protein VJ302_16760 [Blastocatellia bacterium]|nr:hypothetical protein [Blastocatellia bacterium]